jgi:hypothetical protein
MITVSENDTVPGWWQPHAATFPRWHAWRGVNDRYYARLPLSSPPIVVSDKEPAALANLVRQAETDLAPWWQTP